MWPVVSWAIADYYERPKMAYYTIARAMKSVATGISRKMKINPKPNAQHEALCNGKTKDDAAGIVTHSTPHIYPPRESTYAVWIVNSSTEAHKLKVRVRFINVESGQEVRERIEREVEANPTGTTEVASGETPEKEPTVVVSEVYNLEGTLLSYDVDWPQPLKHMTFPDRGVRVEARGPEELVVSAAKPVKGLWLFAADDGVQWSDNALDVVPGLEIAVVARGLKETPSWRFYGMED